MLELLTDKYLNEQIININSPKNFLNDHFASNSWFLKRFFKYNFIGNLYNLKNDIPQILNKFIDNKKYKKNSTKLMKKYFSKKKR